MGEGSVGEAEVASIAARVLGSAAVEVERHPTGFGNENWRVRDGGGRRYVLKVGPSELAAKWRSSHEAYRLAHDAGVPVPELVHEGELGDRVVRVFTWIDGRPASELPDGAATRDRFLRSVGAAVRALHAVRRDGFSSRLDGSAPVFASWEGYVRHRLDQIVARCRATGAVDADLLARAITTAADLAAEVSDDADAVLCHRDLHADNLVVDERGELVGVVDWDAAEAWDRAGDWFKLEWQLLADRADGRAALDAAYLAGDPEPPRWHERRRLVHLIESLNVLPNVVLMGWDDAFADRARTHLRRVLRDG